MPFDYQAARNAGVSEEDIIKYLTQSRNYDVQGARNAGATSEQIVDYLSNTRVGGSPVQQRNTLNEDEQRSADTFNPIFPARDDDTKLDTFFKATGNVPSSLYNMGRDFVTAITNPIDTLRAVGNTTIGGVTRGLEKATGKNLSDGTVTGPATDTFDATKDFFVDNFGSLEALQRTATNDPSFFGSLIFGTARSGASLAGKTQAFDSAVGTTARFATAPVRGSVNAARSSTKFATSQATGLNPTTIEEVIRNPSAFSSKARSATTREGLADDVYSSVNRRLDDLAETGKIYKDIRRSPGSVRIDPSTIPTVLRKYGIDLAPDGTVRTTAESIPLSPTDRAGLNEFMRVFGNNPELTYNAFLNARQALSNLSAFDTGKTGASKTLAKELRAAYDEAGKKQIKGLEDLDAKYSSEKKTLDKIKRDYFKNDGTFKDGAITKIANLTNRGREQILARLKDVVPDIEERIRIVRAVEDIENAFGNKIGTYGRGGLIAGSALFNQIGLAIALILSNPSIAVQLLRALGFSKDIVSGILGDLTNAANDINNFRFPRGGDTNAGLALRDITAQSKKNDKRIASIDREIASLDPDSNSTRIARLEDERVSLVEDNNRINDLLQRTSDSVPGRPFKREDVN